MLFSANAEVQRHPRSDLLEIPTMFDDTLTKSTISLPMCEVPYHGQSLYDRPGAAPAPSRFIEVASGCSEWTAEEKAWLAMNPRWIEHDLKMRDLVRLMNADHLVTS